MRDAYRRTFHLDIRSFLLAPQIEYRECSVCHLRYFTPVKPASPAIYQHLQKLPWYYESNKREFTLASDWISPRATVLEIGCGEGAFASFMKREYYTGVEFNPSAVKTGRDQGLRILQTSIERLASRSETYDIVCSFQVLEHVFDPGAILDASIRCLAPNGRLIVAVPGWDSFLGFTANNVLNLPPHHLTHWPDETFRYLENIYSLKLEALLYTPLEEQHRTWFYQSLIRQILLQGTRQDFRLLDRRIFTGILNRISNYLARRIPKSLSEKIAPRGHTVMAVYRH